MAHIRQLTTLLPQPVRFGLRRLAFRGSGVDCPLCGTEVRSLAGHGGGAEVLDRRRVVGGMRRENDRCPVCHGADRTRMMMLYLERHAGVGTRPVRLLHVAPDFGLYLWLKRQNGVDYTATDLDAARYRHIDGIETADLTRLPFADAAFDAIVCSHVLEHVPDDRAAFAELARVLAPGGHALLLTPFALDGKGTDEDPGLDDPAEQDRRFGQWDHVRIYDRDDFLARMSAAGLAATLWDPFEEDADTARALHLNPEERLPIGQLPSA
ncbi:MAG: methyltransferase domain-containing protein [Paracoccaceae bacterium]|nr:methyltransferase domain-containing protein [Paracoccaceae bacterium]